MSVNKSKTMEITYVTTHLVMTLSGMSIFYLLLEPGENISSREQLPVRYRFYTRGLKLIAVIARTGYRIMTGILISYLK